MRKPYATPTFLRFLLSYVIVLLVPFVLLWTLMYSHFMGVQKSQLLESTEQVLLQIRNTMDTKTREMTNIASKVSTEPELSPYQIQSFFEVYHNQRLLNYTSSNQFIGDVLLYLRGGSYLFSSTSSYTLDMYANLNKDLGWTPSELSDQLNHLDKPVLRKPVPGGEPANKKLQMLYPIPLNSTKPYSTLLITFTEESVRQLFDAILTIPGSNAAIYNEQNELITAFSRESAMHEMSYWHLDHIGADASSAATKLIHGQKYAVTAVNSKITGWTYVHAVPEDELMKPIRDLQRITLLSALILMVIGFVLIYAMMYLNYNPIRALRLQIGELSGKLTDQTAASTPALRQYFTRQLLKGMFASKEAFNQAAKEYGIVLKSASYYVVIVQRGGNSFGPRSEDSQEWASFWLARENGPREAYVVDLSEHDKFAFIVSSSTEEEDSAYWIKQHERISKTVARGVTIGIGGSYEDIGKLGRSYFEAATALTQKWLYGSNKVLHYSESESTQLRIEWYPQDELDALEQAVQLGRQEEGMRIAQSLADQVRKMSPTLGAARYYCMEIVNTIMRALHRQLPNRLSIEAFPDVLTLAEAETIIQLEQVVQDICRAAFVKYNEEPAHCSPVKPQLLEAITVYMNEHFASYEFSVQSLADHFSLSTKYLSTFYKQYHDRTIMEYVNQLRLERARQLLTTTSLPLNEIVGLIGYADVSSFIRKFKAIEQMTPGEYRKQYAKSEYNLNSELAD